MRFGEMIAALNSSSKNLKSAHATAVKAQKQRAAAKVKELEKQNKKQDAEKKKQEQQEKKREEMRNTGA